MGRPISTTRCIVGLRLVNNSELPVSRQLFDCLATAHERPEVSYLETAAASIGLLAWAVRELEMQLLNTHARQP